MSSYQVHGFDLSPQQMKRLAAGRAIRLKYDHLTGMDEVYLTATQAKRVAKAKAAHKGLDLQLSDAQIQHHIQHGSGRFTDFLRKGFNAVKDVAKKGVSWLSKTYGKELVDAGSKVGAELLDKAASRVKAGLNSGISRLPSQIQGPAVDAVDAGLAFGNSTAQSELRKFLEGVQRSKAGRGLFDFLGPDVGGFLNDAGNAVLGVAKDVAIPVGTALLRQKLGGSVSLQHGRGALQHGGGAKMRRMRTRGGRMGVVYDGCGLYPPGHMA